VIVAVLVLGDCKVVDEAVNEAVNERERVGEEIKAFYT
jgi:hypothetical protein